MTMIANSTSAWFDRATQGMGQLRARANALQQQISSGEKQARSSDDPLASSRLRSLARADTLSRVDNLNSDRASADLRLADSALSSFAEYITRAKELAKIVVDAWGRADVPIPSVPEMQAILDR